MSQFYKLEGQTPVKCSREESDLLFDSGNKHVGSDKIKDISISTIFLGRDFDIFGVEPMLFETLISGAVHKDFTIKYPTYEEAEKGHLEAIELVKRNF